ncbi:MAG TPA: hypothetical protein PK970_12765 [Hyphomicrobiaceae bacterium]|nr:hypothetical protein [Hyphomicrobiaceae bacterium]
MRPEDFEAVYEALAAALDRAGTDKHALYLTKVVLMLANLSSDRAQVESVLERCLEDL